MRTDSRKTIRLSLPFILLFVCIFLIFVSFFISTNTNLIYSSPPTLTPDNRPRVSNCLSWKDLELVDNDKVFCVYGYKGRYTYKDMQMGEHWDFYTKSNWHELEGSGKLCHLGELGLNNEVRYYYVRIEVDEYPSYISSRDSDRTNWRHSQYPELYNTNNNCIAVNGELKIYYQKEAFKTYIGFLIIVTNPDAVFIMNNCD